MKAQQLNHYKDRKPEDTIKCLKKLLQELGIETEETLIPKSSADTYSMRVTIRGTNLGTNGKGISESYARASAYAEFFERLQNGLLMPGVSLEKSKFGFRQFHDEKQMTSKEIASLDNSFMRYYFKKKGLECASLEEKAEKFKSLHRVEAHYYKQEDSYEVHPFYSVRTRKVEYIPWYLCVTCYGSNGMSAGNTKEEALVQALSEIIERVVQKKICIEKPCLPNVPDEYIQQFPYIWERIQLIRKIPEYDAEIKDCSFGGKYPVAALLVTHKNTGNYGIKLGCHPDYGVAMERAITEAAQGSDVTEYSNRSCVDFTNHNVDQEMNIYNSYKYGIAQYPYQLFGNTVSYPFVTMPDVADKGNQEILKDMLDNMIEAGYDILIRDVSYTGFSSFQVLIPGLSEIMEESDIRTRALNTKAYLMPILNYPERINQSNVKYIIGSFDFWRDSQMDNYMTSLYGVYPDFDFPGEEMRLGWLYMTSMCCAFQGKWEEAAGRIRHMIQAAISYQSEYETKYRVIWYYMTIRAAEKTHEEAIDYLKKLFSESYVNQIEEWFCEQKKILIKQYPRYDYLRIFENPDETNEHQIGLKTWDKFCNYQAAHPINQQ
ncbi:MAG: YcaO-like family protein [Lachnospiraceae bacterium]